GGRGKGGWQPRAPYQPYQPPSGGGGFGGFASITNQFNDMMGSLAALGQMAEIGTALSRLHQGGSLPQSGGQQPQPSPAAAPAPQVGTREVAEALTGMLSDVQRDEQQRNREGDSRLTTTIRRLQDFVGPDPRQPRCATS
ncbi:unnamed protein product, partial [Prorocentrum cordatum]